MPENDALFGHVAVEIGVISKSQLVQWGLAVIEEAHKLRNAYGPRNKVGQGIRSATEDCRKLLLTATPLEHSLLELSGLSTLIDEKLFGAVNAFRFHYASVGIDIAALRARLASFCKRTLRNAAEAHQGWNDEKEDGSTLSHRRG